MDSSPIIAWKNATAYFTFANHESVVVAVLLISIAMTIYIIRGIMRHEKEAEKALGNQVEEAEGVSEFAVPVEE